MTATLATVFGIVFVRHLHAPAAEVGSAMYLAGAGIVVVPIAMLLSPARSLSAVPSAAVLSAAAGTIHFAAIDKQGAGYWPFVLAFALLAVFQLGWAVLAITQPSRSLLALGVLANVATIFVWAYSRAVDVPIGPMAGKPETVAFADIVSTILESLLVVAIVGLVLPRRRARTQERLSIAGALLFALVLIPPTALALISAVGTHLLVSPST